LETAENRRNRWKSEDRDMLTSILNSQSGSFLSSQEDENEDLKIEDGIRETKVHIDNRY